MKKGWEMLMLRPIVGVVLISGVLFGCGQDPYKDKPDNIKNARPPQMQKSIPEVSDKDLVIDSPSPRYNLRETREVKIQLVAKVLRPDLSATVVIENLEEFPGATFDAATTTFTWTPPVGFI